MRCCPPHPFNITVVCKYFGTSQNDLKLRLSCGTVFLCSQIMPVIACTRDHHTLSTTSKYVSTFVVYWMIWNGECRVAMAHSCRVAVAHSCYKRNRPSHVLWPLPPFNKTVGSKCSYILHRMIWNGKCRVAQSSHLHNHRSHVLLTVTTFQQHCRG
jgi:hypothetical protein